MITFEKKLKGEDLFDNLGKEQEITERKFDVLDNKQKELFDIYNQWRKESYHQPSVKRDYNLAVKLIQPRFFFILPKNKRYDAQSIEDFLINLFKHKDLPSNSGLFISALINTSNDEYFRIFNYSNAPLDWLGYKNIKQISINGDVGNCIGSKMRKGKIILNGNAGTNTALNLNGGDIIINGHIHLFGLGRNMKGGSLYLNCRDEPDLSSPYIHSIRHGRIYHKGKLIVANGRRIA